MFCREGKTRFFRILVICFIFVIAPQWTIAAAPSPVAVIQSGTDRALKIIRSSRKGEAPALRLRKAEIFNIVDEYFNFEEMAKRALGRPWKDQSQDKRREFVDLFKQLLFNTYISRVESYTGSNEQILYDSEKIDGDYAVVKTHVVASSQNYLIEYRLRLVGDEWKAYDVIVEGVSFVDNYRSQFTSILANESFDSLLRKMREKVELASRS
ncbi:MAG: ABC transporter substrate-binding protein [Syntrophobacteraceae bacterium]